MGGSVDKALCTQGNSCWNKQGSCPILRCRTVVASPRALARPSPLAVAAARLLAEGLGGSHEGAVRLDLVHLHSSTDERTARGSRQLSVECSRALHAGFWRAAACSPQARNVWQQQRQRRQQRECSRQHSGSGLYSRSSWPHLRLDGPHPLPLRLQSRQALLRWQDCKREKIGAQAAISAQGQAASGREGPTPSTLPAPTHAPISRGERSAGSSSLLAMRAVTTEPSATPTSPDSSPQPTHGGTGDARGGTRALSG